MYLVDKLVVGVVGWLNYAKIIKTERHLLCNTLDEVNKKMTRNDEEYALKVQCELLHSILQNVMHFFLAVQSRHKYRNTVYVVLHDSMNILWLVLLLKL